MKYLYYQTKNKAIEYYVICESATQIHLTLGAPLSAECRRVNDTSGTFQKFAEFTLATIF